MKSLWQNRKSHAFTLVEMLVVIAIIGILAALLLPVLTRGKQRAQRIQCIGNEKQLGIAFQIFAHDHQGRFPAQVSKDDGGAEEYVTAGETLGGTAFSFSWRLFQPMANELVVPKILVCPADQSRDPALTFSSIKNSNLSYTIGVNASYNFPSSILSTDRNITNAYTQALSLVQASGGLTWTRELHIFKGNVLFADAHVEEWNTPKVSLPAGTTLFLPYVLGPTYTITPPSSTTTSPGGTSPGNPGNPGSPGAPGNPGSSPGPTSGPTPYPSGSPLPAHTPYGNGSPQPATHSGASPSPGPTPMHSAASSSGTTEANDTPIATTSQSNAKETNGAPVKNSPQPAAAAPTPTDDDVPPLLWLFGAAKAVVAKTSGWLLFLLLLLIAAALYYFYSRRKKRVRRR